MKETTTNVEIDKIERVQNIHRWNHYAFRHQQLKKELSLIPNLQIEMELFYGTRTTPPSEIYNGEYGFNMTFSSSEMRDIGSYFAKNASYSCPIYSHQLSNGKYQAFSVQVLIKLSQLLVYDTIVCQVIQKTVKVILYTKIVWLVLPI